jgi:DHA1 family tetracycline resistance protein-like MFS transporter
MLSNPFRSHQAALPFIFVTLVLNVSAFGVVAPVLPQLVQHIGRIDAAQTAELFGVFSTTFAAAQFLARRCMGRCRIASAGGRSFWPPTSGSARTT